MNHQELKSKALGVKSEKIKSGSYVYRFQRQCSFLISLLIIRFFPWIKPNHISLSAILLVFIPISLILFIDSNNAHRIGLVQLLILFVSSVLDKVDGEIARIQNDFSQKGIYYDILYHLFYPMGLYLTGGFFFFVMSGQIFAVVGGLILGLLVTAHKMNGKLRHHISFKINLENHHALIGDFGRQRDNFSQWKMVRILNYGVFMIYDWVWILYGALILISYPVPYLAETIYIGYVILGVLYAGEELFYRYPKESLFTAEEVAIH